MNTEIKKITSNLLLCALISVLISACNNTGTEQKKSISKSDSLPTTTQKADSAETDTLDRSQQTAANDKSYTSYVPPVSATSNEKLDKIVNYISGVKNSDPDFEKAQSFASWTSYTSFIDSSWKAVNNKRLTKMKTWSQTECADANKVDRTVFYPFSGPDFLNAFVLFPNAKTYYLLALEPPGSLPDVSKMNDLMCGEYFDNMKVSLHDIFGKSYFITRKMTTQLQSGLVDGTLPLITFFMKKTGNTIINISKVSIDEEGNSVEIPYDSKQQNKNRPRGMRIDFSTSNNPNDVRTIYYYSCDLSDGAFNKQTKFYKYLNKFGDVTTYLKSASYVLHYSMFVNIRTYILVHSKFILQDDTGIPYKAFNLKEWQVQLYGKYVKPVKDFDGVDQEDLRVVYETDKTVEALPFDLGYHWGSKDNNLMRFIKK